MGLDLSSGAVRLPLSNLPRSRFAYLRERPVGSKSASMAERQAKVVCLLPERSARRRDRGSSLARGQKQSQAVEQTGVPSNPHLRSDRGRW